MAGVAAIAKGACTLHIESFRFYEPNKLEIREHRKYTGLRKLQAKTRKRYEELMGDIPAEISSITQRLTPLLKNSARTENENAEVELLASRRWELQLQYDARTVKHADELFDLFPNNPAEVITLLPHYFQTTDQFAPVTSDPPKSPPPYIFVSDHPIPLVMLPEGIFRPNRIYLDVTEATIDQVREGWPIVEWHQCRLAARGRLQKRPPGRPQGSISKKVAYWVARAKEIGEQAAREEYKQSQGWKAGEWIKEYQWWRRRVHPYFINKRS